MAHMSRRLGIQLFIKRDDQTGLAFGGNKIRNHEFIFGEAVEQGCNAVITTAGVQSNMCRATAAAAARLGMRCVLLLRGSGEEPNQGNLMLDRLLGAEIRFIPTQDPYDERVDGWLAEAEADLRKEGMNAYVLHLTGDASTIAASAYVHAAEELSGQFDEQGIDPERIFVTVGSGVTAAGLALGLKHLGRRTRVVGISSSSERGFLEKRVQMYARATAERLGVDTRVELDDFELLDQYVGDGYSIPTPGAIDAIRLVAREDALVMDPVYTGKCLAGLIDQVERGAITKGESIVFLHTGGVPNLFAQAGAMADCGTAGQGIR